MVYALDGARAPYIFQPPPSILRPGPGDANFIGPVAKATPPPRIVTVSRNTNADPNPGASFAKGLQGTQPHDGDLQFAEMANDSYSLLTGTGQCASTGTQSEGELRKAGWTRMQDDGHGGLKNADGSSTLAVDPSTLEDASSGFRAAVYTDGQGHYVVAYAGTDPSSMADPETDLGQGIGMQTQQYDKAVAVARNVQQAAGTGNVAFTGHSLGGGLAATASAATGAPAVTFNAAGVSDETLRRVGFTNPNDARAQIRSDGQIRSYSVDGDLLSTVDANGAPTQLGTQWHAAWHDRKGNPYDPRNLINIHGGSDSDQSYVEILRDGSPLKPGIAENLYVDGALNLAFAPLGPAGQLAPVRGTVVAQVGNTATALRGTVDDLLQIGGHTGADVRTDVQRGDPMAFMRVGGDLQQGTFDGVGALANQADGYAGRTVTNVTDHVGDGIRDAGRALGMPQGVADLGARPVEYAGDLARAGFDLSGGGAQASFSAAGSALDWGTNQVASAGDTTVHAAGAVVDWGGQQLANAGGEAKKLFSVGVKGLDPHWW